MCLCLLWRMTLGPQQRDKRLAVVPALSVCSGEVDEQAGLALGRQATCVDGGGKLNGLTGIS